ncbi:MAG: hypothetical protein IPI49_16805 [Myxococcales bacterium]|nr:hypothetical protein [Myxococcales bacterium]
MFKPAIRAKRSRLLCILFTTAFVGCVGPDEGAPLDELASSTAEVVLPTTSVCVTKADGHTIRVDGAMILPATIEPEEVGSYVVVPSGVSNFDYRTGPQLAFVERGGLMGARVSTVFVAAGGTVSAGASKIWADTGGRVNCEPFGGHPVIHHEPGTVLDRCSAATLTREPVTSTFRRCAPTTPANQVQPKLGFTLTRSGQTLTVANQTTGSQSATKWRVEVRKYFTTTTTVIFTTAVSAGFKFQLPANFNALYPPLHWERSVVLTTNDPFGMQRQHIKEF